MAGFKTVSIEFSAKIYTIRKKKISKKFHFSKKPTFHTSFFQFLSMKMSTSWLKTCIFKISIKFSIDYKKKIWKKNTSYFLTLSDGFFRFWARSWRLLDSGPVPLKSASNFTLISKKKFEKKILLTFRPSQSVFSSFEHKVDVFLTRDRFLWNQRRILHWFQKKNFKKKYF